MNKLDELIPEAPKPPVVPVILFGEVESVDPLVITVDGDEEPLEIEPSSTVDGILPGDKVAMTLQNDELIVTGIIDGDVDWVQEFVDGIAVAQDAASTALDAVGGAVDAATAALTAANGKNKVYHRAQVDLPPAEDLNDGDIWFDPENDNKPHIFTSGSWLASPLGNAAIGNLDVAKLTGDTITGNFLVAGKFRTAAMGGGVEMDSAGIRVYDGVGDLQTSLNSDGTSTFRGQVEASGVEVLGKLKFHGYDSEVAAGARLNIIGGVTPPTTTPNVYPEWPTITLSGVPKTTITGITRDPANGDWIVVSQNATGAPTATRHNAATGALTATLGTLPTPTGYQYPANGGVAFVDGVAWVPQFINEYESFTHYTTTRIVSTAGTVKTILAKSASFAWSEGERISIGTASSTQVAVSLYDFTRSTDKGRLLLYTPSTSTASGNVACAAVGLRCDPVAHGSFDFGAARFVLDTTAMIKVYQTSGSADASRDFSTGRSTASCGVGFYGGNFWTAHTDRKCYIYDGPVATGGVGIEFASSWYDSNAGGTGVHETPLGPSGWSPDGLSRARLRVHPPLLVPTAGDDGVNSVRIYARVGGSMRLQGTLSTPGASLLITGALASGTIHGSVAGFPATDPGSIENSTGDIVLPGNGMARLRGLNIPIPLTSENIDALPHGIYEPDVSFITAARGYPWDGVPGRLEVLGWVTSSGDVQRFTTLEATPRVVVRSGGPGSWSPWTYVAGPPDTLSLSSLFSAGTPAQSPTAYREGKWVSFDGSWQMAAGTAPVTPAVAYNANTTILTMPAGWRPAKQVNFPSGPHGSTVLMTASIRLQTNGNVEVFVNNGGSGSTGANFALGGVRYRIP